MCFEYERNKGEEGKAPELHYLRCLEMAQFRIFAFFSLAFSGRTMHNFARTIFEVKFKRYLEHAIPLDGFMVNKKGRKRLK